MPSQKDSKIAKTHDQTDLNITDTDLAQLVEFDDLEGLFAEELGLSEALESQASGITKPIV